MSLIPHKTIIIIAAVVEIARQPAERALKSRDIAAAFGVSKRYFESALQELAHAGVIKGVRGPCGGYAVADPAVTVGQIATIVANLSAAEDHTFAPLAQRVAESLSGIEAEFARKLSKITVADLASTTATTAESLGKIAA
jgi:Rrf2 family protein